MALHVTLLWRGGGGVAGSVRLPATPTTSTELRRQVAEQLCLTADLAKQLRLVHRGKSVGPEDVVTPIPDEAVMAILPRGCDLRPTAAVSSPPDDGSPGKAEQPGSARVKRRRQMYSGSGKADSHQRAASSGAMAETHPATFWVVPSAVKQDFAWRVLRVIEAIPRGKVAAYGQVARYAGAPRNARQVGKLLATALSGGSVPWQRVINAAGKISLAAESGGNRQRRLLMAEGVRFKDSTDSVLPEAFWAPDNITIQALF